MSRVHHQKQIGGRSGKHVTSLEYRQAEVDFFGEQRGPAAVSMMNRCVETLTCYVGITCMMSGLSVWRRHEFVWKKGSVRKFEGLAGLMWGYFIFFLRGGGGERKRKEQKVLKGISFSWQQLLRTELAFQMTFQRCRRHSTESSPSYRNGLCRKNKHLAEEEQSARQAEKKNSRKSKGN